MGNICAFTDLFSSAKKLHIGKEGTLFYNELTSEHMICSSNFPLHILTKAVSWAWLYGMPLWLAVLIHWSPLIRKLMHLMSFLFAILTDYMLLNCLKIKLHRKWIWKDDAYHGTLHGDIALCLTWRPFFFRDELTIRWEKWLEFARRRNVLSPELCRRVRWNSILITPIDFTLFR